MTDGVLAEALGAGAGAVDSGDQVVARILDAAREEFARFGVRRSSIDDIAKRAGLSRNTVFRRLGSKDELVNAVLVRELRGLIAEVDEVTAHGGSGTERLAQAFGVTVLRVRGNPMFAGALGHRRDEVLEYAAVEAGQLLRIAVRYVTELLERDQRRGEMDGRIDVAGAAEVIVRTLHSVVLTPHAGRRLHTEEELRAFATEHLAPLLYLR
jgi:AcrR family transcriptional regulator